MSALLKEERQQEILELLQHDQRVTVAELSRRFNASPVTIRRDLAELAAGGRLRRAHRGALRALPAPPEPPVVQRQGLEGAAKQRIAQAALALVQDGAALFIGSGSTTTLFARLLRDQANLTVFTNALNVAADLAGLPNPPSVVVSGGVLRPSELSLLGHLADLTLGEVRVARIFMGAQALSLEDGWTTDHLPEVATTRRILATQAELVILADHSKLGRAAAARVAPLERVRTLVTDAPGDPALLDGFRAHGVQVLLAP